MKLDFEREVIGETTRLILELEDGDGLDQFALNMMNHNRIECLVPVEPAQYDNAYYLQYNITDKDTLDNRISGILKKNEVFQILNSIINAFEETEAYMLSEGSLLLDLRYVFIDREDRCAFLYLPFLEENYADSVSFLQKVVECIQPNYEERDPYLFNILNAFGRGAVKKVSDLKELIRKNSVDLLSADEKVNEPVRQEEEKAAQVKEQAQVKERAQPLQDRVPNIPAPSKLPFAIPGKDGNLPINVPEVKKGGEDKKADKKKDKKKDKKTGSEKAGVKHFWEKGKASEVVNESAQSFQTHPQQDQRGRDEMYESYEQTVMMPQQEASAVDSDATVCLNTSGPIGTLERKRNGEHIEITHNGAVLGSGTGADCTIVGNKAISRSHATISIRDGVCYIKDNHSSNGTWVNGKRLVPDRVEELPAESVIKLANEEFLFRR